MCGTQPEMAQGPDWRSFIVDFPPTAFIQCIRDDLAAVNGGRKPLVLPGVRLLSVETLLRRWFSADLEDDDGETALRVLDHIINAQVVARSEVEKEATGAQFLAAGTTAAAQRTRQHEAEEILNSRVGDVGRE
jgi:hypothetical protein